MAIQMMNAADAAERIRSCTVAGWQVLGVDGFQVVSGGYVGRLDLILDLSLQPISAEEAEVTALHFIAAHTAPDLLFEVVDSAP